MKRLLMILSIFVGCNPTGYSSYTIVSVTRDPVSTISSYEIFAGPSFKGYLFAGDTVSFEARIGIDLVAKYDFRGIATSKTKTAERGMVWNVDEEQPDGY